MYIERYFLLKYAVFTYNEYYILPYVRRESHPSPAYPKGLIYLQPSSAILISSVTVRRAIIRHLESSVKVPSFATISQRFIIFYYKGEVKKQYDTNTLFNIYDR